jgi:3-mercaptopyruvate sulfurtransferase SseA
LFGKDAAKILKVNSRKIVFLADDELSERKAAIIAEKLGYDEVSVLKGGLKTFKEEILNFTMPNKVTSRWQEDDYRFRLKASKLLPQLIEANKHKAIPKKTSKRVLGGC